MNIRLDKFSNLAPTTSDRYFRKLLDDNFERLNAAIDDRILSRNFVDATDGAENFQLPSGFSISRDFFIVKIDASGNAVTVLPFGTETIEGASSLSLAAQYNQCLLTFYKGVWYRMDA